MNNFPVDITATFFRLTLVLSCAMNFKNYPHDEQLCNLKIESSKLSLHLLGSISYTTIFYFSFSKYCILQYSSLKNVYICASHYIILISHNRLRKGLKVLDSEDTESLNVCR